MDSGSGSWIKEAAAFTLFIRYIPKRILFINRLEEVAAAFQKWQLDSGSGSMYIIDKIHKRKFQNRQF